MNGQISQDLKAIKFILDKNKLYIFPSIVIFISIILFFQFVIPQFKDMFAAGVQAKDASLRLELLKQNLNILTNTDETTLDSQLRILNLTLPLDKDFSGTLNSIYSSAQQAGVSIGPFTIQIGDLSKSDDNEKFPTISLTLPVNSDIAGVSNFVSIISKSVPLADVTLIRIGEGTSTINLSFYYKPLDNFDNKNIRLSPVSQKGLSLISELAAFKNAPQQ